MNLTPTLQPGSLTVIRADHAAADQTSHLIAQLALRGPLTVIDGGNRLQPFRITHLLRQHSLQVRQAAERIHLRRAFTPYQLLAVLQHTRPLPEPHLILDLLGSFQDENLRETEARRLLDLCLAELDRLQRCAPLAVTLAPARSPERACLLDLVEARADQHILPLPAQRQAAQLSLW